ncbi:hypothetical protein [Spiroplasma endosymbiont of Aspidapion aeneum]|uniref:hypothetical protein n=1 Tax=Spiroplasma endosymbiont of Aspidapion aeneum TaxID=3066276 RepID=UPI00313B8B8A
MDKKALIVLSKTNIDLKKFEFDMIIGVESGCISIIDQGLELNHSISDFDHVEPNDLERIKKMSHNHIQLNKEKDVIDGWASAELAIKNGADFIKFIFTNNNRIDMIFSIIDLLRNFNCEFESENSRVYFIKNSVTLNFNDHKQYRYVSILLLSDSNLKIKGLRYETDRYFKKFTSQLISNSFNKCDGHIECDREFVIILNK